MPALPAVAKVVRVDLHQTYGPDTRVQNRIFLQYSGAMSQADLTTVASAISTSWGTNMAGALLTSHTLTSVVCTDLSSNTAPQAVNSIGHSGTVVDSILPDSTALVIKFKINKRYRGGHPRIYLVGRGQGSLQTGNTWTSATISSLTTAWSNFIAGLLATPPTAVGTLVHVTVQYFSGFTAITNPITHRAHNLPNLLGTPAVYAVTGYAVNPVLGSQRRRNLQSA